MTVVAFFAHPDDESLLVGGTLAACAAIGHRVVIVSATAGENGPRNPGQSSDQVAATRLGELRCAASYLGASAVSLGLPDGGLAELPSQTIAARAAAAVAELEPDIVISFGPDGLYGHPDHVAVHHALEGLRGLLAVDGHSPAMYFASWPRGHLTSLVAHMAARHLPHDVWGIDPEAFGAAMDFPLRRYDVGRFLVPKLAALRCHRSQLQRGQLFGAVPDDLAEAWMGSEYFMPATNGSGDALATALAEAMARGTSVAVANQRPEPLGTGGGSQ